MARRAMNSMAAATVLLALLAAALPFYQTTPGTGLLHSELLGWCSPTQAIRLLPDLEYARAPATFWAGVGMVALLGLIALGVVSIGLLVIFHLAGIDASLAAAAAASATT